MEELERRLEHPSNEARPSAAVLAGWERGRAKYPAILPAPCMLGVAVESAVRARQTDCPMAQAKPIQQSA
jgi:hypothetical protein